MSRALKQRPAEDRDWRPDRRDIDLIVAGRHDDPFAVLGPHRGGDDVSVRVFHPAADSVEVIDNAGNVLAALERLHDAGFFAGPVGIEDVSTAYRLRFRRDGAEWETDDPYRFPPLLADLDIHLITEGTHRRLYERLGAHPISLDQVEGVAFTVWAPNARRVSVVGEFNDWDGRRHPMRKRHGAGVWELFIPGLRRDALYKFEILGAHGDVLPLKADPFAFAQEAPPSTASRIHGLVEHDWADTAWMSERNAAQDRSAPISIYEIHLGSWRRGEHNSFLDYDSIADLLIPYVRDLGFTHVELLPISEHPFSGSWGYQPVGLFSPTARFGPPEAFARFIDRFHQNGIGVLIDWVPAHFPSDPHGLVRFDGTALYEHEDPRRGFHKDWNTLIYNYGRREVANFLLANALFWLRRYHIDGLRVDAVASMLYLDYSRSAGEWEPNVHGGRENLEAVSFLKEMNTRVYGDVPGHHDGRRGVHRLAASVPSRRRRRIGLRLQMEHGVDARHLVVHFPRSDAPQAHHHNDLTFGLIYAFSENFILPLSHDEVVHGKGSLLGKMPGDRWQKFANSAEPISRSCGPTRERSCCSWAASLAKSASGTTISRSTGTCSPMPRIAASICWCAISITSTGRCRRFTASTASPPDSNGSKPPMRRKACLAYLRKGGEGTAPVVGRLQLHAGGAPRLSPRRPHPWPMDRKNEHRRCRLWRIECRQSRRRRSGGDRRSRSPLFARAHLAAACDHRA